MAVLPMFPLGSVLLPGGVLPLHVFEPRYRRLVTDCVEAAEPEFGVVLIEQGREVGGGEVRRAVGTVARMVQVAQIPDGRFAVVSVGVRRVRVQAWLPDDPYPVADVDDWDDEPDTGDVAATLAAEVAARVRRAAALAVELGDPVAPFDDELSGDPVVASYQLTSAAPMSVTDQYDLLCEPGPVERLRLLAARLDDVEAVQQLRLGSR